MSEEHDSVRKAEYYDRLKEAKSYKSWYAVAKAAGDTDEFFEWICRENLSLKDEADDFADCGFEDEDFPTFMYRTYQAETGRD